MTPVIHLPKDLKEFVESLNSNQVDYVVVGAFALAFHGHPRYTGDIDLLVRPSAGNADRLLLAISGFGFASAGLSSEDFVRPGQVVQLGRSPNRIDILTSITGVDFEEAWASRVRSELDGATVSFIGRESLIKNKKATGRAQDKADLEALGAE